MIERKRIFALLRMALGEEACDTTLFSGMTSEDWKALYRTSVQQGITALIWDGVSRLPAELRPPKGMWISWSLNTEKTEERFARYCKTANQLATFFAQENIPMMQLKGTGLAEYYPVPEHREGGDIDIYLFGHYERANRLIQEQGIPVDTEDKKHHKFYFQGIPIENHVHFLNIYTFPVDQILEKELLQILEKQKEQMQFAPKPEMSQVLLPPPDFNALFLMRHAITHFATEGIVLRHLCDWYCFLKRHGHEFNFQSFQELITACRLTPIVAAFTAIVVEEFGLSPKQAPMYAANPQLKQRVLDDIFQQAAQKCKSKNPIRIFLHKCKVLRLRKWKYDLIYNGLYWHSIKSSIIFHIRHPETILRLK